MKGRYIYIINSLGTDDSSEFINKTYSSFDITNKPRVLGKTFNISRFNETYSKTLYVGTSKSLKARVKQHFGYDNKRIYPLDLIHWFPKNIDISLNVYEVSTKNQLAIELLEQSIWDMKEPQFGKRSGL